MIAELKDAIRRAEALVHNDDLQGAMVVVDGLLVDHRDEVEIWLYRGYLHGVESNYGEAKQDMDQAIALNSFEPHLLYNRGRFFWHMGQLHEAIQDFSRGLELCDFHKSNYYREELHFWRAEALIGLGKKEAARKDVNEVADDFRTWTDQLRTKAELVFACR